MKRVAPELESLMWTLAEEGNERAIDEFGARHPELRVELLRRIAMVKGLRGEKKRSAQPAKAVPRFVPKEQKSYSHVYVVGSLVLAAACALAYLVTIMLTPPPHGHKEDYVPSNGTPIAVKGTPPASQPQVNEAPKLQPNNTNTTAQNDQAPPLKPGTLKIEHAQLLTVLELMAQTCGVRIDPAPGMPNPYVEVDYRDMTAMEMLRTLGRQYRFTPLDQHDGSILVVPAIDPNDPGMQGGDTGGMKGRKLGG